jgi:hypothetical protein
MLERSSPTFGVSVTDCVAVGYNETSRTPQDTIQQSRLSGATSGLYWELEEWPDQSFKTTAIDHSAASPPLVQPERSYDRYRLDLGSEPCVHFTHERRRHSIRPSLTNRDGFPFVASN